MKCHLKCSNQGSLKLANDQVILESTLNLLSLPLLGGYLNVVSAGSLRANGGELVYAPNQFTLGKINIPPALFRYTGPIVFDEEWQHGSAGPLFRSLQSIVVGNEAAVITNSNLDIDKNFVRDTLIEVGESRTSKILAASKSSNWSNWQRHRADSPCLSACKQPSPLPVNVHKGVTRCVKTGPQSLPSDTC